MKRLIYFGFMLIAGSALAQPMEEITARDTIDLRLQQTRTFVFSAPITSVTLSAKDVAEVVPESNRTINMRGLKQGQTLMTVYGVGNSIIYRANISVNAAGVGYVKIYGLKAKDYSGYYCSESGCSRSDLPPDPFSTTVSDTKSTPDGSQTISREYR